MPTGNRSGKVITSIGGMGPMRCCTNRPNPGATLQESIDSILDSRNNVVMVRVNDDALSKLDALVEAGIVDSRSEAAAFLIGEGVGATGPLFDRIGEKIRLIKETREELRKLLEQ